ncbi:tRNA pseudouridine synthase B [Clostridia bacterium]|nr:tRNA pseudouridine synthase B [Clostridia bacterium]
MSGTSGILLVNKQAGWTSHDVVAKVRKNLHTKKVGHAGTLDPMATGVLPICIGKATKIVDRIAAGNKQYKSVMKLGVTTNTQDTTGDVLKTCDAKDYMLEGDFEAKIHAVVSEFVGDIEQIPPMFSAIKIDGQKLYSLARKGIEVERPARKITIFAIEILSINGDLVEMLVDCSKGTYIRTLCHDIGGKLGCGACMASLQRTKVGRFCLEECSVALDRNQLISIDELLRDLPEFIVNTDEEIKIKNGCKLPVDLENGEYRIKNGVGELLAISRADNGVLELVNALWM